MKPQPSGAPMWEGRLANDWQAVWSVPRLEAHAQIGSTNDRARVLAETGAPAGTVVLADYQTAGRGRSGSPWAAPPGSSLLFSMIMRPAGGDVSALTTLPVRTGLAVLRALRLIAAPVAWKWPNDVLTRSGRKVAGILCEGAASADGGFVIAGIGINVAQRSDDFPEELRATAASLRTIGCPVPRAKLAGILIPALCQIAAAPSTPLDAAELAELDAVDALKNRRIAIGDGRSGVARGIAPDGALILETDEAQVLVRSGTVRVVEDA